MKVRTAIFSGAALAIAAAGVTGALFWAHDTSARSLSPMAMSVDDPADFGDHAAQMARHLDEVNATPEQKARIDALLTQAKVEFAPVHNQVRADRDAFVTLLTQDRIDRDLLEELRQSHLQMADQASRRKVQLIADIADVLTVEQRKALVERAKQLHGGHRGFHHGG